MEFFAKIKTRYQIMAAREIMWHGTSYKNAIKILKTGFVPNPGTRGFSGHKSADRVYDGSYFTRDFNYAVLAGDECQSEQGGDDIVIFQVQLETRTGLPDEDEIPQLTYSNRQKKQMQEQTPNAEKIKDRVIKDWFRTLKSWISLNDTQKKSLHPYVNKWLEGGLESKEAEKKAYLVLTTKMRGFVARSSSAINIRMDQPVGFSGANKILAAVRLHRLLDKTNDIPWEKKTQEQRLANTKLIPLYGYVDELFKQKWDLCIHKYQLPTGFGRTDTITRLKKQGFDKPINIMRDAAEPFG